MAATRTPCRKQGWSYDVDSTIPHRPEKFGVVNADTFEGYGAIAWNG
jgi:hypothetical protein